MRSGCSDAGTGQRTILAQIAAEELGVPLENVDVRSMDTDDTPWVLGVFGSRGTHYAGHAVRLTASQFAIRLSSSPHRSWGLVIRLEDGFARSDATEIELGALA